MYLAYQTNYLYRNLGPVSDDTQLRTPPALPARWVDARPLVGIGTAAWFVAWVTLLIVDPGTRWAWVSLAGWLLGFAGFAVIYWQRSAARRGVRGAQQV